MKGVNMVIVEEKYFWKLYESNWNNNIQQSPEAPTAAVTPRTGNLKNSALIKADSKRESVLRSKASEYIEIVINSLSTVGGGRKFTFYRDV